MQVQVAGKDVKNLGELHLSVSRRVLRNQLRETKINHPYRQEHAPEHGVKVRDVVMASLTLLKRAKQHCSHTTTTDCSLRETSKSARGSENALGDVSGL